MAAVQGLHLPRTLRRSRDADPPEVRSSGFTAGNSLCAESKQGNALKELIA
jgi:hypothetical protein